MKPIGNKNSNNKDQEIIYSNPGTQTTEDEDIIIKIKSHMENGAIHVNRDKAAEWDSKETQKGAKAKADAVRAELTAHSTDTSIHVSREEKAKYADKYSRNEVDNKIAAAAMGLIWQPPVETTQEFKEKYYSMTAVTEGWFVAVNKEGIGYRYTNKKWQKVKMFIYPLATETTDGLMSIKQYNKLNGIEDGANNYVHPDMPSIRHVSDDQIINWDQKADNSIVTDYKAGLMSPEMKKKLDCLYSGESYTEPKPSIWCDDKITVTIGPKWANPDYVVGEDESLHKVFEKIQCNNAGTARIILLPDTRPYFTNAPIVINRRYTELLAYDDVFINNTIHGISDKPKDSYYVIDIKASDVVIKNIGINNTGLSYDPKIDIGGIRVYGARCKITDNHIMCRNGIKIIGKGNIVTDNEISNCNTGIWITSTTRNPSSVNFILRNKIEDTTTGILLSTYFSECQLNTVSDNYVENCLIGICIDTIAIDTIVYPKYNKVLSNSVIIDPKYIKNESYTIYVNGSNNIIGANLIKGKGLMLKNDNNKIFQNYEV